MKNGKLITNHSLAGLFGALNAASNKRAVIPL